MIRLLLDVAVGLFVPEPPAQQDEAQRTVARRRGRLLVLAVLPALIAGLFFPSVPALPGHADPEASARGIGAGLSCLGALVILSRIAYATLALRKKLFKKKKDPWEMFFTRSSGRSAYHKEPLRSVRAKSVFNILAWGCPREQSARHRSPLRATEGASRTHRGDAERIRAEPRRSGRGLRLTSTNQTSLSSRQGRPDCSACAVRPEICVSSLTALRNRAKHGTL